MLLVSVLLPEQFLELSLDAEVVQSVVGHCGCSGSVSPGVQGAGSWRADLAPFPLACLGGDALVLDD